MNFGIQILIYLYKNIAQIARPKGHELSRIYNGIIYFLKFVCFILIQEQLSFKRYQNTHNRASCMIMYSFLHNRKTGC